MPDRNRSKNLISPISQSTNQLSVGAFHNFSQQLSLVEEDPNSGRNFPADTDVSHDFIPARSLTKNVRNLLEQREQHERSKRSSNNRPTPGEARLRAAQAAYDEIMGSLSVKWKEEEEPDRLLAHRPRQYVGETKNSVQSLNERRGIFAMPKVDIPAIPLEKLKMSKKLMAPDFSDKERTVSSARAVESLKKALRPVQLKHPSFPNGLAVKGSRRIRAVLQSEGKKEEETGISDEETDSSEMELDEPEQSDGGNSFTTLAASDQNRDPRDMIDNLWNGYALRYVNGPAGTPKWSKTGSMTSLENQRKESLIRQTRQSEMDKLKTRQVDAPQKRSQSLLPTVVVQKHNRSEKSTSQKANPSEKAESGKKKSVSSADHSRASSKSRSTNDARKNQSDQAASGDSPASSARTWNMNSPRGSGAWTGLRDLQRKNESQVREKIRNRSASSASHSARSRGETRPSAPHQVNGKSSEKGNARQKRTAAMKYRSRSLERYKAERLEKEVSDFTEMRNQFRAHPLPTWINEKKYEHMVEEAEQRKRHVQARAAALLADVQPFNFSDIPDRHSEKRMRLYAKVSGRQKPKRRRPPPISPSRNRSESHSADGRESQKKLTSQPFSYSMPRNFCSKHLPPAPSFKPTINPTVPDFARLHANLERRQETFKLERNLTTIPRPFSLGDTAVRKMSSKEQSTPPSSDKSAESQNKFQRRRSQSVNRGFDSLVRPTKAFSLLTAFSKMKIKGENGIFPSLPSLEEQQRADRLRQRLLERNNELADMAEMVSTFKRQSPTIDERSREYMEDMAEVKRRLDERPFIWERSKIDDRRKRIDARFQEILRDNDAESIFQRGLNGK